MRRKKSSSENTSRNCLDSEFSTQLVSMIPVSRFWLRTKSLPAEIASSEAVQAVEKSVRKMRVGALFWRTKGKFEQAARLRQAAVKSRYLEFLAKARNMLKVP